MCPPIPFIIRILCERKHISFQAQAHRKLVLKDPWMTLIVCSLHFPVLYILIFYHLPPLDSLPFPTRTLLLNEFYMNLSSLISQYFVFFFSSSHLIFPLSMSPPTPAPCSYLRPTAPVLGSSTSWCPRVCRPVPLSQKRTAPSLPTASARSARAPTAWQTVTRSAWDLLEKVKG